MLSNRSRWMVVAGWMAWLAVTVAVSIAMQAKVSTIAFLFALGLAPGIVAALLAHGAPAPTVAEILHSVETNIRS